MTAHTVVLRVVQDREQAKAKQPSWYVVAVEGDRTRSTDFFFSKDRAMRESVKLWPYYFPQEVR